MEFFYNPVFVGNSRVRNEISDTSGSFEATSVDLPIIKEALRKSMPTAKPSLRMEYAARSFGYRTAAAMQSALNAATEDNPVIMTPLVGPLDDDRLNFFLRACPKPTTEALEAAHSASRAVSASRGERDDLPVSGVIHRRHVVHPLNRDREFSLLPELTTPDLRLFFFETARCKVGDLLSSISGVPEGWYIEFLTPENTSPEDISRLEVQRVAGYSKPEILPVFDRPIIERDRVLATMLVKNDLRETVGFVTFSFTIGPISGEEADSINRDIYGEDIDDQVLGSLRQDTRCDTWRGTLHIEAMGDWHPENVGRLSTARFDSWVKDHAAITAAFREMIDDRLKSIAFELSRADTNEDDDSLGRFILDLTCNGAYVGNLEYDAFALDFHEILESCAEMSGHGRVGETDRDIKMMLCKSVYDYASEAFAERHIESPYGPPYVDDDLIA